jgi:hypothetical protein
MVIWRRYRIGNHESGIWGYYCSCCFFNNESDGTALTSFLPLFSCLVALDHQGPAGRQDRGTEGVFPATKV